MRAPHQVPFDLDARIVLLLRQRQHLASDVGRLVELAAVQVEGGETAQDREPLRHRRLARQGERLPVHPLGLLRVATEREEPAGEAHPERDLVVDAVGGRRRPREHLQQVVGQSDSAVVPPARVIQRPEGVQQPVELRRVARVRTVPPRGLEVPELRLELVQGALPTRPTEGIAFALREVGEGFGVGAPSGECHLRVAGETLDRVFADRLEHR